MPIFIEKNCTNSENQSLSHANSTFPVKHISLFYAKWIKSRDKSIKFSVFPSWKFLPVKYICYVMISTVSGAFNKYVRSRRDFYCKQTGWGDWRFLDERTFCMALFIKNSCMALNFADFGIKMIGKKDFK